MIGTMAVREEIGGARTLLFYWEQEVSHLALSDAPMMAAIEQSTLDCMVRAFDAEMPPSMEADVVGPFVVDQAQARKIVKAYGATMGGRNLAADEVDLHWPPTRALVVVGAHVEAAPAS